MVFSSTSFLFLFLPVVMGLYWLTPRAGRNLVLLAASLLFYIWGGGALVVLLLVSTVVDYFAGALVATGRDRGRLNWIRAGVLISVLINVGLLSYFKYANFFVDQLNRLAGSFGWGTIAWESVVLPIGISFFTFQSMSYTIDVARGRCDHLRNPIDFALYVALFPQLIAGPIVRFHEIAAQLRDRQTSFGRFGEGALRFVHGLVKKVIVADSAGLIADAAFASQADRLTAATAWVGVIAYTIQIYFDFSGYSDMAIGLGRMFGFQFPENFKRPYSAVSITDFWRRWHITLSNWFRDYLYVPLGGSRHGTNRTYLNLVAVFVLTGFWHGANWTFLAWGLFHGTLLILERVTGQRALNDVSYPGLRRAGTFLLVMIGWVLFRADTLTHAWHYLHAMFAFKGGFLLADLGPKRAFLVLALSTTVTLIPGTFVGGIALTRESGPVFALSRIALMTAGLGYALVLILAGSYSPFLYFQF